MRPISECDHFSNDHSPNDQSPNATNYGQFYQVLVAIVSLIWIRIGKDPKLRLDPDPEQLSNQGLGQRKIIKEVKKRESNFNNQM
jgi:hypothetical protein